MNTRQLTSGKKSTQQFEAKNNDTDLTKSNNLPILNKDVITSGCDVEQPVNDAETVTLDAAAESKKSTTSLLIGGTQNTIDHFVNVPLSPTDEASEATSPTIDTPSQNGKVQIEHTYAFCTPWQMINEKTGKSWRTTSKVEPEKNGKKKKIDKWKIHYRVVPKTRRVRPLIGPVELKCVNFGIDTMLCNFKFAGEDGKPNGEVLPEDVSAKLDAWRLEAEIKNDSVPVPLHFCGQSLNVRHHGSKNAKWLLFSNDYVDMNLSYGSGRNNGIICKVRFASRLLWSIGASDALVAMEETLWELTGGLQVYVQMSEIHICADIQGWYDFYNGVVDWKKEFVRRVPSVRIRPEYLPAEKEQSGALTPEEYKKLNKGVSPWEDGKPDQIISTYDRDSCVDFGNHGSAIMAQVYDKTAEIKKSRKDFFEVIWEKNGWDGKSEVTRFEARLKRKALASLGRLDAHAFDNLDEEDHEISEEDEEGTFIGLGDAYETLSRLPELWHYVTAKWLRYVDPDASEDSNRSRMENTPVWNVVQGAYKVNREAIEDVEELPLLIKKKARAAKKKNCVASLRGYLTSLMALSHFETAENSPIDSLSGFLPDILSAMPIVVKEITQLDHEKRRSFVEDTLKKRFAYGFITDEQLKEAQKHISKQPNMRDVAVWKENVAIWQNELGKLKKECKEDVYLAPLGRVHDGPTFLDEIEVAS